MVRRKAGQKSQTRKAEPEKPQVVCAFFSRRWARAMRGTTWATGFVADGLL
jgi:hypothetical protein